MPPDNEAEMLVRPADQPAPNVSVVMPVYNGAEFLADAIASVYAQTVLPEQVVVINDGSTDGTEALLRRLEPSLPSSFGWVSQENRGVASAHNRGVSLASGELIAFLDQDDTWHPTKLARQLEHFASDPSLSLSFTGYRRIIGDTATVFKLDHWDPDPQAVVDRLMWSCIVGPPCTVLLRREILNGLPGFDESLSICDDWLMWLNVAGAGLKVGYLPDALADYRWHGGNLSGKRGLYLEEACEVLDRFFRTYPTPAVRRRSKRYRARWHMEASIYAIQNGDKPLARRHILKAARTRPRSIRPGWVRMLGLGAPPQ
jgi:glycosyltransferase involved in cell wall biosynthesis